MKLPTQPDSHISHSADGLWLADAVRHGGAHWVANARCEIQAVELGQSAIPVSALNRSAGDESYVASPRSAWHRYAIGEGRRRMPPAWQGVGEGALRVAGAPLSALIAASGLDHAAIIDNWLLSTNLHAQHPPAAWHEMTDNLVLMHPSRPLMLRNVCDAVTPGLPAVLQDLGYRLIPARLIYLAEPRQAALWRHNHVKTDQRLLASPGVELLNPGQIAAAELKGLRDCFRSLFIDKHSVLNPDFTPAFFTFCRETRFLSLFALRHAGRIAGVLGVYARHGWLTTPLIGYDTTLPAELGLYRRLMALLLHEAREQKCRLHYSAGAGSFKRVRGGEPHLEYAAVYARHLPDLQRAALGAFAAIVNRVAPKALRRAG